jgi:hypothetical protein
MPKKTDRQYDAAELPSIVKADSVEVHYDLAHGDAVLHATGCKHRSDEAPRPINLADLGADDWFYVAPCAKKKTPAGA